MPETSNCRNRSASLEHATLMDDQQQRKRPRLDSAEAGATEASFALQEVSSENNNHEDSHRLPSLTKSSTPLNMARSPTSKVTINTRSAPSPAQPCSQETSISEQQVTPNDRYSAMIPEPSPRKAPADAISISSSSSAANSPEIQVAEVEDFDQDESETRWQPLDGNPGNQLGRQYLLRTFPYAAKYASEYGRVGKVLPDITRNLTEENCGEILTEIQAWLSEFLQLQDQVTPEFLDFEPGFWTDFPDLISAILRRDRQIQPRVASSVIENFFIDFGRLLVRFLRLDLARLRFYTTETRAIEDLRSRPYLQAMGWILQPFDIPLYNFFARTRTLNVTELTSSVMDKLVKEDGDNILDWLTQLIVQLKAVLPKRAALGISLLHTVRLGLQFVKSGSDRQVGRISTENKDSASLEAMIVRGLDLFAKADDVLQHVIAKQQPWLTIENTPDLSRVFVSAYHALGAQIEGLGAELVQSAGVVSETFTIEDSQALTCHAWKMRTLRKLIVSGRMELRVWGVAEMQQELVSVYKAHVQDKDMSEYMSEPLVRFLVAFIRDTKLIDYIIGVDSHPQLISRSPNIVGFLTVTGRYLDSDTDMMWRTVTESEDPRIVKEVLRVMSETAALSSLPALLYYCTTLLELPFERYNSQLVIYAGDILDKTYHKIRQFQDDSRPLQLCIHLLRNASAPGICSIDFVQQIRETVHNRFQTLLSACGGELEKRQLWSQCIADITADNAFATGSIEAIQMWSAWAVMKHEMPEVQSDLTEVLVKNIVHFATSCGDRIEGNSLAMQTAFEIRWTMLARLILSQPDTMTPELLESLWNEVFTAPLPPSFIHDIAWNTMTQVIKMSGLQSNSVVDALVNFYLPTLRPQDFNPPCLNFLKRVMESELKLMKNELTKSDGMLLIPGADRIERVMLEAPPNTVESDAADFIITKYLDHEFVTRRSSSDVKAIHKSLVDRCVRQVIAAASLLKSYTDGTTSGEDEPMVIIAPAEEIQGAEMRFDRWLLFLRKFLEGINARPAYSPKTKQTQLPGETFERRGETIESTFQVYKSSHIDNSTRRLIVGRDNTGAELWDYLADVTGFEKFRVLNGGRDVELKDVEKTLSEIRLQAGNIIVIRHEGSAEKTPHRHVRASSLVDATVMDNFSELYALLDLDERLAKEIFGFLCLFPAQSAVVDAIRSRTASPEDLLPVEKPYRLLYCARALRSCVESESFASGPDSELLKYGVKTITCVLPQVSNTKMSEELRNAIVKSLLEGLLLALRAKVVEDVSLSYFDSPQSYVAQLLAMLESTTATGEAERNAQTPLFEPFEAILEGALHDSRLWPYITTNSKMPVLFRQILLASGYPQTRKSFCKLLLQLSGAGSTKLNLKVNDPRAPRSRFPADRIESALAHLWTVIAGEVQHAEQYSSQSQEFFDSSIAIFRKVSKSLSVEVLQDQFQQWSNMLASHHHTEVVGRASNDHIVPGVTKLLQECCKVLRVANVPLEASTLSTTLLSKFLLPFSESRDSTVHEDFMPVLSGSVRGDLYDLLLLLNNGTDSLPEFLKSLSGNVQKDFFEAHTSNDRLAVRSEVGYAGLRNLANTCYLNSLFSHLFMNLRFRDMVIHASIEDESKQSLLVELGKVFSRMQNSYNKFTDPSLAVESIVNYDNERIDVAIQMDVDEFYNLLFDRLEWQFLVPAEREALKSLYGGQLVQQIKSRNCDHISETFENFTTVQLEIRGKKGLEDSLKAYVEGEILQGDNKYKCSQCDSHVDAVKRACLKDVPNNLIFNLKRFDYDIMTGMRAKVNDEFDFPESVDMAPYTIEGLSQPEKPTEPDLFELVGVIVHTGTADSGHYYSFTRERPSSKEKSDAWVQFNDSEVTVFDLETLKENCFGGVTDFNFSKIYSAYMLFYERTSSIQKLEMTFENADPVRIALLVDSEQSIDEENQKFLQSYCVQDPSHARFMRQILERMRPGETAICSDSHELEADMLIMCLDYVQHVSSRWKEHPELDMTRERISEYVEQCQKCAYVVVKWFIENDVLRDRIIRSPYPATRNFFKLLLYRSLQSLRLWYTLPPERQDDLVPINLGDRSPQDLFADYVEIFGRQWDYLARFARAWEDYFELLCGLVKLGSYEMLRFLDDGLLERLLEIILANTAPVRNSIKEKVRTMMLMKERGRHFGLQHLLEVLDHLLEHLDIRQIQDEPRDVLPSGRFGVNSFEAKLLGTHPDVPLKQRFDWLRKATVGRQNPVAVDRIVGRLAGSIRTSKLVTQVLDTGVNDPEVSSATHFLGPIITFCQQCKDEIQVHNMIRVALDAIYSIGTQGHREHLDFVTQLFKIENVHIDWGPREFGAAALSSVAKWAPPLLLSPPTTRDNVSEETCNILSNSLWLSYRDEGPDVRIRNKAIRQIRELTFSSSAYVQENVLKYTKDRISLQPGQATYMVKVLLGGRRLINMDSAQGEQEAAELDDVIEQLRAKQVAADQAVETVGSPEWMDGTSESEALSDAGASGMMTPSPNV